MSWSDSLGALAIGYDSGEFEIVTVDVSNPLNYKETFKWQPHKQRIMGIWLDGMRNLVYTISEDKSMKVTDIKIREVLAEVTVSNTKLTCLEVDTENKNAWIADRGGQIHIYDLIPTKPQFIQILTTPSKTALRGLQLDMDKEVLFASSYDDGFIYGYKLGVNGGKVIFDLSKKIGFQPTEICDLQWPEELQTYPVVG
jgi:hypothetical protein